MLKTKLLGATAAAEPVFIEDVFSTYLHTGTGSSITITNGIDLAGEGGLVWVKIRNQSGNHLLFDTQRGTGRWLETNSTGAENGAVNTMTFNSNGFTGTSTISSLNRTYASWTFRKAPRFFDVVTYTGNGTTQAINHNLGSVPGVIITKRTDSADDWTVYHRSEGATRYGFLHLTNAFATSSTRWNDTAPTATQFYLGNDGATNGSGGSFVAYLFAHDPLGPSGDGSDGLIACGSLVSGTVQDINLGWEPQFIIYKNASNTAGWAILDTMRGMTTDGSAAYVLAESSSAEATASAQPSPLANGFRWNYTGNSGNTFIYIAIRRGPMREPTSGTEVFETDSADGTFPAFDTTFPVDLGIQKYAASAVPAYWVDRLRGTNYLDSSSTSAEASSGNFTMDSNVGWRAGLANSTVFSWMFRRAPGFFDVVAYTGDGVAGRTVSHNLSVAPEMIVVFKRIGGVNRVVYHTGLNGGSSPEQYGITINTNNAEFSYATGWNNTAPSDANFTVGTHTATNDAGNTFIAYIFATLAGVSKVGSYTGNGSSQTINCGFTSGARFILIKRTDSTGDWYVWDTARGIVTGNDPHLSLNTTAAEVTTDDTIDPDSSGFIVNQVTATNVNVSSASYIYLAIA